MSFFLFILALVAGLVILRKMDRSKLKLILPVGAILITGLFIYYIFSGGGEKAALTGSERIDSIEATAGDTYGRLNIESGPVSSAKDRVAIARKRVKLPTPIQDVEFQMQDVNAGNDRSLPGATDRDYKLIMKVHPQNLGRWTTGFDKIRDYDYSWMENTPRFEKWGIQSQPEIYKRPGEESYILIFRRESIIAKRFEAH